MKKVLLVLLVLLVAAFIAVIVYSQRDESADEKKKKEDWMATVAGWVMSPLEPERLSFGGCHTEGPADRKLLTIVGKCTVTVAEGPARRRLALELVSGPRVHVEAQPLRNGHPEGRSTGGTLELGKKSQKTEIILVEPGVRLVLDGCISKCKVLFRSE